MKKIIFLFLILFIFSSNIEVEASSITIQKHDSENKERLQAILEGSVFGIYKDDILINELTTDSNGTVSINNLSFGNYTIKELTASKGYNIDKKIYEVTITNDKQDIIVDSYSKVIESIFTISSYYKTSDGYEYDETAVFEIYNKGNLITTLKYENDSISGKLEYGLYMVKQVNGKKYYNLAESFYVPIYFEQDTKSKLYTEKTDEIKAYEELLEKREEVLNRKEQELTNLKQEMENKQYEFNNEKEELKIKQENLVNLENELNLQKNNLDVLKEEISSNTSLLNQKEIELKNKEEELEKLKIELNINSDSLKIYEDNLNKKELEIKKEKDELNLLSEELKNKENNLKIMEASINDRKIKLDLLNKELIEKEKNLKSLEASINESKTKLDLFNKEKVDNNVLVVEVPNTSKQNYNKLISVILIIVGIIFIIYSKKKVTSH